MTTSWNGISLVKYSELMIIRATHSAMMSRAVTSAFVGWWPSICSGWSGQPCVANVHSWELNQVSSTFSSWWTWWPWQCGHSCTSSMHASSQPQSSQ